MTTRCPLCGNSKLTRDDFRGWTWHFRRLNFFIEFVTVCHVLRVVEIERYYARGDGLRLIKRWEW